MHAFYRLPSHASNENNNENNLNGNAAEEDTNWAIEEIPGKWGFQLICTVNKKTESKQSNGLSRMLITAVGIDHHLRDI